jgi:prepilin-type N-terminal cleavage/methylation domain-containing protein
MKIVASARYVSHGFSLIELAIVLFIVALLLGGLLPTIGSQIEQKNRSETRKQLEEIQQALMGYAIINKRLPCPASKIQTITANPATAGKPDGPAGACTSNPGVLPWIELGLPETDAWGRRFTYAVTAPFTSMAGITLASNGSLTIKDAAAGVTIASSIPVVIISHGTNGLGAYTPQGAPIPNASAGADEKANALAGATTFVIHETRPDFDDQVVWISTNTLFNRMVAAGVLSN